MGLTDPNFSFLGEILVKSLLELKISCFLAKIYCFGLKLFKDKSEYFHLCTTLEDDFRPSPPTGQIYGGISLSPWDLCLCS